MASRAWILLVMAVALAGCGGGQPAARGASGSGGAASRSASGDLALPAGSRLLATTEEPVTESYAAAGSLYFTETIPAAEHTAEIYRLVRVDAGSGRVAATRSFAVAFDHALMAGGSLWVTTSNESQVDQTSLWRLNPGSLAVRSHVTLPSASSAQGQTGSLAVTHGQLWVGTGTLDRVSLTSGRVDRVVHLGYPGSIQVAADPSGRILLASLGYQRSTDIARLDPVTGTMLAHVASSRSLTEPSFGGIADGGAWIDDTTGPTTIAERLSATTLKPTRSSAWAIRSNRIFAQVIDGVLWVTERDGQDNLNYCANPVSGRPRARLPLLPGDSVFLTADAATIYFTYVPVNAKAAKLMRAPIDPACGA